MLRIAPRAQEAPLMKQGLVVVVYKNNCVELARMKELPP
jgi:hypothetical protein